MKKQTKRTARDLFFSAAIGAAAFSAGGAFAQEGKPADAAAPKAPAPETRATPDDSAKAGKGDKGEGKRPDPRAERHESADADKDGKVSKDELNAYVATLFGKADEDGDGALNPREFARVFAPSGRMQADGPGPEGGPEGRPGREGRRGGFGSEEMLQQLDKNKDGKLQKEELPEPMQGRFERMDRNGDGALDKEEMRSRTERRGRGPRPDGAATDSPGGPGGPAPQDAKPAEAPKP